MQFKTEQIDNITIVTILTSILDINNVNTFKTDILPLAEKSKRLVFDLNHVEFIDSPGCGVLLACFKKISITGGEMKFCGVQKSVRTLFKLVRFYQIIDIFDTIEEAVISFKKVS